MKQTSMMTAVYCLIVKFSTPTGVGYIKTDQATARQCHIQSLQLSHPSVGIPKKELSGDVLAIEQKIDMPISLEELDPCEDYPKPKLVEQTEEIQLGREEGRVTRKENSNVFAWSAADMPGISSSVIRHSLNINPNAKPVRQKKRQFAQERVLAIKEETDKLLKIGFIQEAQYPD